MADPKKALKTNVGGNFFVDSTCIDCDTCRQIAPATFVESGNYSTVFHQPDSASQEAAALRALLCCPTGSIGTHDGTDVKSVIAEFPQLLDTYDLSALSDLSDLSDPGVKNSNVENAKLNVFYCGFNSPKSYGGNSFFVQAPGGNWLIDSPRYVSHLVNKFEELGGIKYVFLTHRDDVADASRYAEKFGAAQMIHRRDLDSAPESEIVIDGEEVQEFLPGFKVIPTPGHTEGHMILLVENKYLFTGDHLAYDREAKELKAFREHCWYSWSVQIESMQRLSSFDFEWILAGHGDRVHLPLEIMRKGMSDLVARMKSSERH